MVEKTTGAMQEFGTPVAPGRGAMAGLVLLYTEEYPALPPAFMLDRPRLVVGRDETADLPLPVGAVSRIHAELSWERSSWVIRDLGSRNGTLVDGRPVSAVELEPGNEIRIGDAIFKFVDKHAELYSSFRIDGALVAGGTRRGQSADALVGGYQMDRIGSDLVRIAPTPLSVMLLGESGTGKEVVARELHRLSGRRGGFYAVNCAAIPGPLLESELFGYKRGAFSGADRDKPGLIRLAHGGTLLLDEIGDMPLEAQAKLLRVLQAKEVFPLGATAPEQVDVRIVCATHRDLWRLQKGGSFREDLFARLNEYQLRLPPLRDRKEDVYMLVRTFLARHGGTALRPTFAFMIALLHYDWPYNVRELEACIKRCVALSEGPVLDQDMVPEPVRQAMSDYGAPLPSAPRVSHPPPSNVQAPAAAPSAAPTEAELRALLTAHAGNIAAVGRELGKARMQVHRWMKRFNIQIEDYRS
ncbi:MAG: sigma 54-dependent Fis family transcriptional regulator [Myxococcales bacterium]|nr:sigma 54-dependent Fis family transcriptional regulator [Myxococcales bacterium]MCB9576425.1 sigma 54-dependent Fis family transcriptional regulator [Polyangiaceae bacterium]